MVKRTSARAEYARNDPDNSTGSSLISSPARFRFGAAVDNRQKIILAMKFYSMDYKCK